MSHPSVRKNYKYRLFYELLVLITPLITAPYVSRVLGADGVGVYSYTSSIMSYFTLFAALGTASYGAREIAQHRDDRQASSKLFWEIELMTVFTSSVCIVVWVIVILVSTDYRPYFLALLPLLFGTMLDISWYFTGHEKIKNIVIRNSLCKIAGIAALFIFVREKSDLTLYIFLNSLITLIGNLSMWFYLPKILTKVDFHTLHFKRHLRETLVYFIPTIATSVYTVLDKTLIGVITKDTYQNGYYEQANKIITLAKSVVFTAVNSVMGARMSYLFSKDRQEEVHRRIGRSMDFIFLIGFGAVFGILAVAERFVPVFFGDGYEPVVSLLRLMSPLVLIIGISNCLGSQYYTPSGRRAQSSRYLIFGSGVNLILNLGMIPFLGAQGAVIASLAAEGVISVLYVLNSGGYMTALQLLRFAWKKALAGCIMLAAVTGVGMVSPGSELIILVIQCVVGVGVYFLVLLLLRDGLLLEFTHTGIEMCRKVKARLLTKQ